MVERHNGWCLLVLVLAEEQEGLEELVLEVVQEHRSLLGMKVGM
jgi:hypothetical protein